MNAEQQRRERGHSSKMPKFALKYPFFILMLCLIVTIVGIVNLFSMPVDLFPDIDMPVVVVATFYSGMPPAADRSRHHQHLRALLYARRQRRPQRVALPHRRQPHQDLLQAGHRSQRRAQQRRQPGDGRSAPPARLVRCPRSYSASPPPPSLFASSPSKARASTKRSSRTSRSSRCAIRFPTSRALRCRSLTAAPIARFRSTSIP